MALEQLSNNLNIIQDLVISGFLSDLDIIQKLDDEPNDVGGLTAAELKAKFDEAGNIIKDYINNTLLPGISDTVAEEQVRAQAEQERIENENTRISNEEERQNNEQQRETRFDEMTELFHLEWVYLFVGEDGYLYAQEYTGQTTGFSLTEDGILEVVYG